VLKKMTMLANSLSHTILLGIVIAYILLLPLMPKEKISSHCISVEILLLASLISGVITTLLTHFLSSVFRLQEDASTGLVFTTLFALGIVLITALTRNAHIGLEAIMGNVDALHLDDLFFIFWIACVDLSLIFLLYKEWKVTTFDAPFAQSLGFSRHLFNYFLMVLTAVTVIGAFRAVGVLLVLAFLVAPVLTARLFCTRLMRLLLCACGLGIVCALFSVALSRHFLSAYQISFSTSGLTVACLGAMYFLGLSLRLTLRRRRC
jgi:manganese/zinc/iron transport system permease protein